MDTTEGWIIVSNPIASPVSTPFLLVASPHQVRHDSCHRDKVRLGYIYPSLGQIMYVGSNCTEGVIQMNHSLANTLSDLIMEWLLLIPATAVRQA